MEEFVEFFSARVQKVLQERRKTKRDKVANRFREVMQAAQKKVGTLCFVYAYFFSLKVF